MTLEQITDAIRFSEENLLERKENPRPITEITGALLVQAAFRIDQRYVHNDEARRVCKEHIKHEILHLLYENRRLEIMDVIMDIRVARFNSEETYRALEKLITLITAMPPQEFWKIGRTPRL